MLTSVSLLAVTILSLTTHCWAMDTTLEKVPKTYKHPSLIPIKTSDGFTFHVARKLVPAIKLENHGNTIQVSLDSSSLSALLRLVNPLPKKPSLFNEILKRYPASSIAKMAQTNNDFGWTEICTKLLTELLLKMCGPQVPHFNQLLARIKIPPYLTTQATLTLQTADNKSFTVNKHLAYLSNTIKNLADECDPHAEIILSQIDSPIFATILRLLNQVAGPENERMLMHDIPLDFDPAILPRLLCALNYLDIPWLLQYVIVRTAMHIHAEKNYTQLAQLLEALAPNEKNKSSFPLDIVRLINSTLKLAYKRQLIDTCASKRELPVREKIYQVSPNGRYAVGVNTKKTLFLRDFKRATSKPFIFPSTSCPSTFDWADVHYGKLRVTFSKDNHYLLLGIQRSCFLYPLHSGSQLSDCKILLRKDNILSSLPYQKTAFTPDNKHVLLILGNTVSLFDITNKDLEISPKKIFNIHEEIGKIPHENANLISCNNDESLLLFQGELSEKSIVRCSFSTPSLDVFKKLEHKEAIALAAGNEIYVLTAKFDGTLCLYDMRQKSDILESVATFYASSLFELSYTTRLTMSSDNKYVLLGIISTFDEPLSKADTFILIDLDEGSSDFFLPIKVIRTRNNNAPSYSTVAAFCGDKNSILLADKDKLVRLDIFDTIEKLQLPALVLKIKLLQDEDSKSILQVPYFDALHKNMPKHEQ